MHNIEMLLPQKRIDQVGDRKSEILGRSSKRAGLAYVENSQIDAYRCVLLDPRLLRGHDGPYRSKLQHSDRKARSCKKFDNAAHRGTDAAVSKQADKLVSNHAHPGWPLGSRKVRRTRHHARLLLNVT